MKRKNTRFKFVNAAEIFDGRRSIDCITIDASLSGIKILIELDSELDLNSKEYVLLISDKKVKLKLTRARIEYLDDSIIVGFKIEKATDTYNGFILACKYDSTCKINN